MNYAQYIRSNEWAYKAMKFKIMACFWRLSLLPLFGHAHHIHYRNLGNEKYLRDIIIVGPFMHMTIIHGLLSLWQRPSEQQDFPNILQDLVHVVYQIPAISGVCLYSICCISSFFYF